MNKADIRDVRRLLYHI